MRSGRPKIISIVVPVYERVEGLEALLLRFEEEARACGRIPEALIVDDGSGRDAWDQIVEICSRASSRAAIRLQRNFGQHAAIRAGLEAIDSDLVLVSDSDLAQSVDKLSSMVDEIEQGAKVVALEEEMRSGISLLTKFTTKVFYLVRSRAVVGSENSETMSFVLISREAQEIISRYRDHDLVLGSVISHSGLPVVRIQGSAKMVGNRSSYSTFKKVGLFVDLIFGGSRLGSSISIGIGLFLLAPILALATVLVVLRLIADDSEAGFTALALLTLFGTAINVLLLAIVLRLNETIIAEVKRRPSYVISERVGRS